jgi:aryl sulfotransferase
MPALLNAPTRHVHTMIMNSARWADFQPRAGDVIVATYPKCGTTWTQRIVSMLIHGSPAPRDIMGEGPWVDATIFDPIAVMLGTLNSQPHRRSMKSHLPLQALPVFEGAKVVHTVRDGRDACISMHNHMLGIRPDFMIAHMADAPPEALADGPPPPTPEDPREWYLHWMDEAEGGEKARGADDLPFCEFELGYWAERKSPWLLHVHYADLKVDLEGEIARISEFLEIDTPPALLREIAAAATFDAMKRDGAALLPKIGEAFDKGPERFLNKGTNGRWKDFLTPADLARYDALIKAKLSPDMANWIANGRLVAGDPRSLGEGAAVKPS